MIIRPETGEINGNRSQNPKSVQIGKISVAPSVPTLAVRRDCILTDKLRFETQAIKRQLVLNTWSGLLMDEDSLPDDRINTPGVLVGIRPKKDGIG
jgi:hypothetical protein